MRFLTGATRSLAQIRDEVLPNLAGCHLRYPGFGYWAAETRAGGEFIGWFGLRPVTPTDGAMEHWPDACGPTGVVSLGYRLRRSAWGQGYATEGARALVRLAFTGLGVREVVATTMAVNTGSRRVMEKAACGTPVPCTWTGRTRWTATSTATSSTACCARSGCPLLALIYALRLPIRPSARITN